ncbi:hypothetical protein M5K25_008564 [Dendrobium thyrsiflorum]|uniref:Uncharacterized protein n=1 Tax=Dendrobium thyrsiflorum TaxID=117978 RepID=A0ABD0VG30_DENTH
MFPSPRSVCRHRRPCPDTAVAYDPYTGRKVEVLEGELGQLKTDFEEKISDFQNQFSTIHEKIDGRFAALEDLMKKMMGDKQKPATFETTGGHGRGGNPNPSRGRENPKVEDLKGDDGMPPLESLSREEMSMGLLCNKSLLINGRAANEPNRTELHLVRVQARLSKQCSSSVRSSSSFLNDHV